MLNADEQRLIADIAALEEARGKPDADADTAAAYLATGDYRWNAGMFVVRAGVLLDHLAELRPQLAQGIEAIAAVWDAPEREEVLAERWPALEKIAIDHAIAEPVAAAGGVATVPVSMGWNDVGGFDALTDLVPPRTQGEGRPGKNERERDNDLHCEGGIE